MSRLIHINNSHDYNGIFTRKGGHFDAKCHLRTVILMFLISAPVGGQNEAGLGDACALLHTCLPGGIKGGRDAGV